MPKKLSLKKFKNPEQINQVLQDAWLNIYVDEKTMYNPFDQIPEELSENPELYVTWLLTRPEYFSFICQEIFNITIAPIQGVYLNEIWNHRFPMFIAHRGGSKTFTLALYCLIRALLLRERKIIVCGAAFRQSKILFEYMETIYQNAPIFRDILGSGGENGPKHQTDMFRFNIFDSYVSALPLGNGDKIRGQRANDIIADEFSSIPRDIFETVIIGFGAVAAQPIENMKKVATERLARDLGIDLELEEDPLRIGNQVVISGTPSYIHGHFGEYWTRWRDVIRSKGDIEYLRANVFKSDVDEKIIQDFNWKDYSIIRVPVELSPKGLLDDAIVSRAKATIDNGTYLSEYGAIFPLDSSGFFKRSLIDGCTTSFNNPIIFGDEKIQFEPLMHGDMFKKYVYGIDPASEIDNFSITILELNGTHRRCVYCWTTNRSEHKERIKLGLTGEHDFFAYVTRKIRDLMRVFPCEAIAIDSQGGGRTITESLHDMNRLNPIYREQPLWPAIEEGKYKDTDLMGGQHILHLINFAQADWVRDANNGLKKDMQDKILVFPAFDNISLGYAGLSDEFTNVLFDGMEDNVAEIEELKNELTTIVVSQSPSGRQRWDTPEIKLPNGKKGYQRKDRYSSLLMANMVARDIQFKTTFQYDGAYGGFATSMPNQRGGYMYSQQSELADKFSKFYEYL